MKFIDKTNLEIVRDAASIAESLLNPVSKMMLEISKKNDFKYNSGSGAEVYKKICESKAVCSIKLYRPFNPWTKAIGYFDGKDIFINSRKINSLSHLDLFGLLCHEFLHAVGFSHGDNWKTSEKIQHSVNYFVSEGISQGKWL